MSYNILLVEDSPTDADLFQEMLVGNPKHKFHVEVIERLSLASEQFEKTSFDLVLLDLSLPDSHGLETFVQLQSLVPHLPIIVLTGLDDETLAASAVSLGAQEYVIKNSATSNLLIKAILYSIERKRIQEALRIREETLHTLVSHLPDIVFRVDRHLFIRFVNSAAGIRLHISEYDLLNKSIDDLHISTDILDLWKSDIQKVFETEKVAEIEFYHDAGDDPRYYRASLVPEYASNGLMTQVLFIARDLTEYRRNQDALIESTTRYQELFENAQDIIYTLNMSGELTSINKVVEQVLGYSREKLLGINFDKITSAIHGNEDYLERARKQLNSGTNPDHSAITFEVMIATKYDEYIPLEISSRVMYRQGKAVGIQGIARDIRDRKEAEAALRKSEEDFRLLAENSTDMISRHTPDGIYIYVSPACYALLGYHPHEMLGQSVYELLHPDDLNNMTSNHAMVLQQPDTATVTYRIRKKSGEYTWFETTSHQVRNLETNEIQEIQTASRDITERKEAEMQIHEAQEFAQNTVNSLSAHLAIVDESGDIVATNTAWNAYALANGGTLEAVGAGINYFRTCEITGEPEEVETAAAFADGLRSILNGTSDFFSLEYRLGTTKDAPWFVGHITPYKGGGKAKAVIVHESISKLKAAEEKTKDLNRILKKRNVELTSISETGRALASTLNLREIYWTIFNSIGQILLDSQHFVIADYNDETQEIACQFAIIDGEEKPASEFPVMPLGMGPTSDAIRSQQIKIVDLDLTRQALKPAGRLTHIGDERLPMSGLYVPLIGGDHVRGVMSFQSYTVGAYDDVDLSLISLIASQAAVALENGRLYYQIKDYANTLEERVAERTERLAQLNRRMAAILNNTSDAILLITDDGRIEVTNPAFNQMFGYESDELLNQSLTQLADPSCHNELLAVLQSVQESKLPQRLQMICKRKDGSEFDVELSLAGVPNNKNHIVCTIFDISQFKVVERIKDQFISTVNHEIRTPIAAIVLSVGTLNTYYDRLTEEQRLRKIDQIQQQSRILTELIDSILDIARIEAAQNRSRAAQVDVCRSVVQVIEELRPSSESKSQNLTLSLGVDSIILPADPTDLLLLWRNLIGNAIKYTPNEGTISVLLDIHTPQKAHPLLPAELQNGTYLIGCVEDTGHGIASNEFKHLFTRFYRGWAKNSPIPGTGLGLALVRELLTIYDGDIVVNSQLDTGSTFTFWIPL